MKNFLQFVRKGIATRKVRFVATIVLFAVALSLFGAGMSAATADVSKKIANGFPTGQALGISHQTFNNKEGSFLQDGYTDARATEIESQFANHRFDRVYDYDQGRDFFKDMLGGGFLGKGFVVADEALLANSGYALVGRLPADTTEICITEYMFQCFRKRGFPGELSNPQLSAQDVIGKTLELYPYGALKIVGILDTKIDFNRYLSAWESGTHTLEEWKKIKALESELRSLLDSNYHSMYFVNRAFTDANFSAYNLKVATHTVYEGFLFGSTMGRWAVSKSQLDNSNARVLRFAADAPLGSNEILISYTTFSKLLGVGTDNVLSDEDILKIVNESYELKNVFDNCQAVPNSGKTMPVKVAGIWFDQPADTTGQADTLNPHSVVFQNEVIEQFRATEKTHLVSSLLTFLTGDPAKDIPLIEFAMSKDADEEQVIYGWASTPIAAIVSSDGVLKIVGSVVGTIFLVFTVLMMANFIAATIAAKRKEIGIMRALGGSKAFVFGIYLTEALVAAGIAFVLSVGGMAGAFGIVNKMFPTTVATLRAIQFNVWGILITLAAAVLIAVLGCLIPTIKLTKKKPTEMINS